MTTTAPRLLFAAGSITALATLATAASAQTPTSWTIELVARSSLDPGIAPFRLPFPSSLSSQAVALDETGSVAFRSFLGGSEGIFYGDPSGGSIVLTGTDPNGDPVFQGGLDVRNGRISVSDGGFNGGAAVYDTAGMLLEDFAPGGSLGVSGIGQTTLSDDGAICYRADFGFTGDRLVVDRFVSGVRTQTEVANTFSGNYTFILTPRMNASGSIAANTIPASGPSRRIVRFDPHEMGGFFTTTIAETGPVYTGFVNSTSIASDRSVGFNARRAADGLWTVNRADPSGAITTIAEGGQMGIVSSNLANFPPVTNANGLVAFRVEDSTTGSTSLFVGDGTTLVRLVGAGDTMPTDLGPIPAGFDFGGTTGVQTMNSLVDINDQNQVAFMAFLQNGTIGVFVATPDDPACAADWNGSDTVDVFDILDFLSDWEAMDPATDLTGEGDVDIFDILAFLGVWEAGCP